MITLKQIIPVEHGRRVEFRLRIGNWSFETNNEPCGRLIGLVIWRYEGSSGTPFWQTLFKWRLCKCWSNEVEDDVDDWPQVIG